MPEDDTTRTNMQRSGEHHGSAGASDVLAALTAFRKEVTAEFRQIREGMANEFRVINAGMTRGVERFTEHDGKIRGLEDFRREHLLSHKEAERSSREDAKEAKQPGLLLTVVITVIATIGASALVQVLAGAIAKTSTATAAPL